MIKYACDVCKMTLMPDPQIVVPIDERIEMLLVFRVKNVPSTLGFTNTHICVPCAIEVLQAHADANHKKSTPQT